MKPIDTYCLFVLFILSIIIGSIHMLEKRMQYNEIAKVIRRELKVAMNNPEFAQLLREKE